jgi:hypothetical protein
MDTDLIKKTVTDIRNSENVSENILRMKYAKFAEDYPRLFEFSFDKKIDLKYLDMMLEQLKSLNTSSINLDTADSNVYGILKNDFIPKEFN